MKKALGWVGYAEGLKNLANSGPECLTYCLALRRKVSDEGCPHNSGQP
ncbi:hypothetical protein QUF90_06945 [Desulfococcaceae bacterium HSG9]|nr:hypothetical protein [Desulfococcaceae bacterium HSG9]